MCVQIRLNLFRELPRAPPPSGDPDEEQAVFTDPQWTHLSVVYEILLRIVTTEQIDLALKKKAFDPSLVKQLLLLFDSEDSRERDYLKVRNIPSTRSLGTTTPSLCVTGWETVGRLILNRLLRID